MSKTFHDFFPDQVQEAIEQERVISSRLPPFKLKPVDEERAALIRMGATKTKTVKGNVTREIDGEMNMLGLVVACVTYPDLHDSQLQSAWGVMGAEALVKKMLLPGEYAALSEYVAEICGFDQTMDELVEEAKN